MVALSLAGLAALAPLTGLTSLGLSMSTRHVTDVGLAALAPLTGLTSLDMRECDRVTNVGLAALQQLTGLRKLSVRACAVFLPIEELQYFKCAIATFSNPTLTACWQCRPIHAGSLR